MGDNGSSRLGLGPGAGASKKVPTEVTALSSVVIVAVAAGNDFTLALDSSGVVWAWGGNGSGQLGLGDSNPRDVPTQLTALSSVSVVAIAAVVTVAAAAAVYWWMTKDDAPSDPQTQAQAQGSGSNGGQSSSQTGSSTNNSDQRDSEYHKYKDVCEEPEKGFAPTCLSECEQYKYKFDLWTKCHKMRQEWDDKYERGRHTQKIKEAKDMAEQYRKWMEQACK
jgi:hypothetical protein